MVETPLRRLRNKPVEDSADERTRPEVNVVIVDVMGEYLDWARRNPDIDAIPYAVGKPLPHVAPDNIYIARNVDPLVEWALSELAPLSKTAGFLVHLEQWPAST